GAIARLVTLLPVAVPALTLGFGYIAVFSGDTLPWLGSLWLLVLAHAVLTLPYLTQTLIADLRHLDIAKL
ncbi:ABC transporter permease, partial [Pandoraea pneumonica]